MRLINLIKTTDFFFFVFLVIVSLLSYSLFSPINSPYYQSDHAVYVLMTSKFSFSRDLYYWGQDRTGSLLPLLSHLVYLIIPAKPIIIISIAQYLSLFFTCLIFSSFFKSYLSKTIVVLAILFPPLQFIELLHIGHPYSAQFLLLAISIYCYRHIENFDFTKNKNILLFSAGLLCLLLTIWISDLSIVFIATLGILSITKRLETKVVDHKLIINYKGIFRNINAYLIFIVFLISAAVSTLIWFAKKQATPSLGYTSFNSRADLLMVVKNITESVSSYIIFLNENIYGNMYVSLVLIFFILMIYYRKYFITPGVVWYYFFLWSSLFSILIIISSRWVLVNDVNSRYFIFPYVCITLCLLFCLERFSTYHKTFLGIILLSVTSFGMFYTVSVRLGQTSVYSTAKEFSSLGKTSIIAGYWNSYIYSSLNPDSVFATPHDKDQVRNTSEVGNVIMSKNIYLIKDGWLESFPDSITQFGHKLHKEKDSMVIGKTVLQRYKNLGQKNLYSHSDLFTQIGVTKDSSIESSYFSDNKIGILSFGPYIYLGPGKYKVTYAISGSKSSNNSAGMLLKVTSSTGQKELAERTLYNNEFTGKFQNFEIEFEILHSEIGVEFVVQTLNENSYWLDYCKIEEI